MNTITTIIPTYRRPRDLERCLRALQKQTRLPNEVLIVVRDTDVETQLFLEAFISNLLQIRTLTVRVPGVVAAMNVGLDAAQGDIIAFTDDDAAPHTDWLAKIETHFLSDQEIGGVGGRDYIYQGNQLQEGSSLLVGQVSWFGRVTGNHHLGIGEVREVDVLKGVNMSFRYSAIKGMRFDEQMRGTGAQVHFELAFCLALKQKGWKLNYDPQVAVDHYPALRFDEDQRRQLNEVAFSNAVHNETLALLQYLPLSRHPIFLIWALLVGTRQAFGLIQWLRFLFQEGQLANKKWFASIRGRWQGWSTWQMRSS